MPNRVVYLVVVAIATGWGWAGSAAGQTVADPAGRFTFDVPAGLVRVRPPDADAVMAFATAGKRAGVADEVVMIARHRPWGGRAAAGHRWHGVPVQAVEGQAVTGGVRVNLCAAQLPVPGEPLDMLVMTRVDRGPSAAAVLDFALDGLAIAGRPTSVVTGAADVSRADAGRSSSMWSPRPNDKPGELTFRRVLLLLTPFLAVLKFKQYRRLWNRIGT